MNTTLNRAPKPSLSAVSLLREIGDWNVKPHIDGNGLITFRVAHKTKELPAIAESDIGLDTEYSERFTVSSLEVDDIARSAYTSTPDIKLGKWAFKLVNDDDGHLTLYCRHKDSTDELPPIRVQRQSKGSGVYLLQLQQL